MSVGGCAVDVGPSVRVSIAYSEKFMISLQVLLRK